MSRLRELFQEVDTRKRTELGFDDFATLYHKLLFDDNVSSFYTFMDG
jgi:phosphatidylinositol phospholipase C gamma-1